MDYTIYLTISKQKIHLTIKRYKMKIFKNVYLTI